MATQMLQGKIAVVFGAGGSIGAAVAKEFAAEGAEVFLAGRNTSSVDSVVRQIALGGAKAHAATVDTLDEASVDSYLDEVVDRAGKIDVVLDAAGPRAKEYGNGKNAVELPIQEFMVPLATYTAGGGWVVSLNAAIIVVRLLWGLVR
jgi:3-oxoacyl-[acyl-carrier protein] reductase